MTYTPRPMPNLGTVEELRRFVEEEFKQIALQTNETTETYYRPVGHPPFKLRDGIVAFADGIAWNPGLGAGLYEFRGGAWHKLS
jgi:hypothetical protein